MSYDLTAFADLAFETSGEGGSSHFFGYYDKSPLDATGNRLLSHRVDFDGRRITDGDTTTVGYWDLDTEMFVSLGETAAFNWQQGSMLQWLPPDYRSRVVYNDRDGDSFVSVMVDVETGDRRTLDRPIYAVHPSGEFALAANFERLYFCRPGYNYKGVEHRKWDQPIHGDDGIYRVNLETGDSEHLVSTATVCDVDPNPIFERRDNWLEHMLWNPSGTRFAFFHRTDTPTGDHQTRLFTADPDGSDLFMFPDTGFYSHMGWRTDERFTIWAAEPATRNQAAEAVKSNPVLERAVRPVYQFLRDTFFEGERDNILAGSAYLDYTDRSHDYGIVGEGELDRNGHNTWRSDGRWMLTDTYPDENGIRHLLLWDDEREHVFELGRFDASYGETAYRCDLHPRWSHDEERIVVDTAHRERRQMMVVDPDWEALQAP